MGGFNVAHVPFANAQEPITVSEEAIMDFDSTVNVNLDNSVNVQETIVYFTGPGQRHGIYRDINPYSSEGRLMSIVNVSVIDDHGSAYPWQLTSNGSDVRIKIGDPNVTFYGTRIYHVAYTATNAVAHLKDVDEIYWNVTGNDWVIPVIKVETSVHLPSGVTASQSACYYGSQGSKTRCDNPVSPLSAPQSEITTSFTSPGVLDPGSGLTIAVGFSKGVIPAYTASDNASNFLRRQMGLFFAFLLPLLVFIFMYMRWNKIGRDPKGRGVIIPQYDVPDGLTPFEVAGIMNQKVTSADFSAEIVNLATRGYIKIKRIDNKVLGLFKSTDYVFEYTKGYNDQLGDFDQKLLDSIFIVCEPGQTRAMSDMKNKFYTSIPGITGKVVDALLSKGYYSNLKKSTMTNNWASFVLPAIYATIIFGSFLGSIVSSLFGSNPWIFVFSIAASVAIASFFHHIMPAKTVRGVTTKEYLLGLKDYLQIAEKDRMKFANAPEKKPEIFEKLLPYAMVLGVYEAWAKEFADIYVTPPSWYEGYPAGGQFNSVIFVHNLSSFNSMAASSMSSRPGGGGGSGGGGFSGGGGGGGGGGGW